MVPRGRRPSCASAAALGCPLCGRARPQDLGGGRAARLRAEPAARRSHAGQLGQGRVPGAPAPHAGALASDLAAQPYHLPYESL